MKYLIIVTLFSFCCLQVHGQDYLQLASECFEKGDYECAKRNYTLFQTFDGRDMSAQIQIADECMRTLMLADDYFKDEEWAKSKERYQVVLKRNPKDSHAKKQLDLCEERLKAANEAKQELEQRLEQEEAQKEEEESIQIPIEEKENKPAEIMNLPVQQENIRIEKVTKGNSRSGLLFVAGGVSIAGGIAASVFLTKPYTEVNTQKGVIVKGKEYNLFYAAAGIVAGGVCMGTGIMLKKKEQGQPRNMDMSYRQSSPTSYHDNHSYLNLVTYGNEIGLRLTF